MSTDVTAEVSLTGMKFMLEHLDTFFLGKGWDQSSRLIVIEHLDADELQRARGIDAQGGFGAREILDLAEAPGLHPSEVLTSMAVEMLDSAEVDLVALGKVAGYILTVEAWTPSKDDPNRQDIRYISGLDRFGNHLLLARLRDGRTQQVYTTAEEAAIDHWTFAGLTALMTATKTVAP